MLNSNIKCIEKRQHSLRKYGQDGEAMALALCYYTGYTLEDAEADKDRAIMEAR